MRKRIIQKTSVILLIIALLICTACSCAKKNRAIHLTEEQADEFLSSRFHGISGIESADLTTEAVGGKSGRAPGPTDTMTYGIVMITREQADAYRNGYRWEKWENDVQDGYTDVIEKSEIFSHEGWLTSKDFTKYAQSAPGNSIILMNGNRLWICYFTN